MALRDPDKTRQNLLGIAACMFQQKGYNGTSLSDIINRAEVSKGALYHHFSNKQELLYAVVDELYREKFLSRWKKLEQSEDPIESMALSIESMVIEVSEEDMCNGCPIHNLLAELGSTDDGLRSRVNSIFCDAKTMISTALESAQLDGQIASCVDCKRVALFFMCSLNGMPQMVTSCQNREVFTELTAA